MRLIEFQNNDTYAKINKLITTGGPSNKHITFSDEERKLLLPTIVKNEYVLYRGMSLVSNRIDKSFKQAINDLKIGDTLPNYLKKYFVFDKYASYTKSKQVAKYYGSGGEFNIIVQANVTKANIIADIENYKNLGLDGLEHFKDDVDYLKSEKEVIVDETNINPFIIFVKGRLK